jgi:hypothetical protein
MLSDITPVLTQKPRKRNLLSSRLCVVIGLMGLGILQVSCAAVPPLVPWAFRRNVCLIPESNDTKAPILQINWEDPIMGRIFLDGVILERKANDELVNYRISRGMHQVVVHFGPLVNTVPQYMYGSPPLKTLVTITQTRMAGPAEVEWSFTAREDYHYYIIEENAIGGERGSRGGYYVLGPLYINECIVESKKTRYRYNDDVRQPRSLSCQSITYE